MTDIKSPITQPTGDRHSSKIEPARTRRTEGWEAYTTWLNRSQPDAAGTGGGRHGAITRNLNNWTHYKQWAEKVRDSWEQEPPKK